MKSYTPGDYGMCVIKLWTKNVDGQRWQTLIKKLFFFSYKIFLTLKFKKEYVLFKGFRT